MYERSVIYISFDKPFLNYQDQIKRLQDVYRLEINDIDFAIHALSTISYYDLINGYKDIFMQNGVFKQGTSIEYLYSFHLFDKKFQNILFRYSVFVENLFKTRESYTVAKNLGVDYPSYLDDINFLVKSKGMSTTYNDVKTEILKIINLPAPPQPTKHYRDNHNHIPPWILFRNISFGNSINLYRLMNSVEKSELTNGLIANNSISYSQKVEFVIMGLNLIRSFRNQIAHNLKFVTYRSSYKVAHKTLKQLVKPGFLTKKDIAKGIGSDDVYSQLLLITAFLDDSFLVSEFLNDILSLISLEHCPLMGNFEKQSRTEIYRDYANITGLPQNLAKRIMNVLQSMK